MLIIETCPECGHDLVHEVICTYPPIPRKHCPSCGWSWTGEREEVMRVPFGGNSYVKPEPILPETATIEGLNGFTHSDFRKVDSLTTIKECQTNITADNHTTAKPYALRDNLKKIEKLPTGSTSDDCIRWEHHPTMTDIHEKIDEIIEVLNELTALHTKTGEILD